MTNILLSVLLAVSGYLLSMEASALPGYAGEVGRLCINQPLPLPKPVFPVSDCLGCHSDPDGGGFTLNEEGQTLLDYHQDKSSNNLTRVLDAFCKGAYYNTQGNGALPPVWNTPQNPATVGYLGALETYWLARLGTEKQTLTLSKGKASEQSNNLPSGFNLITSPANCWGDKMNFGLVSLNKPGNLTVTVEADQSQGSTMIPGFALYQGWDTGTEAARHNPIFFGESNPLFTEGLTYVGDALGDTPGGKISKTFYGLDAGKYEVFVTVGNNESSDGAYTVTFQTAPPGTTVFIDPVPVKGAITSDLGGLNCGTGGSICQADFKNGDQVTLTATPDPGNSFSGWKGVCTGFETTCALTINASKTVSALFKAPSRILTVNMTPTNKGVITSQPKGVQCGGPNGFNCNPPFELGTNVVLSAVPNPGYRVQQWSGDVDCGDSTTCAVLMDAHKNVAVAFAKIWTLTVSAPEGLRIISEPAGIDCTAATCSQSFDNKTVITLKATSINGKKVQAWTGACAATHPEADCTLTLTSNLQAGATQAEGTQVLTVTKTGAGRISSSPDGIDCGDICSQEFPTDTPINLTAFPDAGQRLKDWEGCDAVNEGICTLALSTGRTVAASFAAIVWELEVEVSGSGGRITSGDGNIDCPALCNSQVLDGKSVQLAATPAVGYEFIGWAGCGQAGNNPVCSLTMSKNQRVIAQFSPIVHTVSLANGNNGRVTSEPAGLDCPGQCLQDFPEGTPLQLTATPKPGYRLAGWTGPCAGAGVTCQFPVNGSVTVEARFELIVHTLTVSFSGRGGIVSEPRGIKCGVFANVRSDDCSEIYLDGDQVTLKPQPEAGQVFTGWGGACQGTGECVLTLSGNMTVTATFTQNGLALADGSCGPAAESTLGSAPSDSAQLCSSGQVSGLIQLDDSRFTWTCQSVGANTQAARCYSLANNGKSNQPPLMLVSRKIKPQDCRGLKLLTPGCGFGEAPPRIDALFSIKGGAGKGKYVVRKSSTPGTRCKTRISGKNLAVMTGGKSGTCTLTAKKLQDRRFNEVESLPVTLSVGR